MKTVNMQEAKSSLSRLIESIEQGKVNEVVIARNGRAATRLLPSENSPVERRIGVAKGKLEAPDDIDAHNDEVALLFTGGNAK